MGNELLGRAVAAEVIGAAVEEAEAKCVAATDAHREALAAAKRAEEARLAAEAEAADAANQLSVTFTGAVLGLDQDASVGPMNLPKNKPLNEVENVVREWLKKEGYDVDVPDGFLQFALGGAELDREQSLESLEVPQDSQLELKS